MMARQILIDARLEARPGKAEELADLLRETQRLSCGEDGCVSYRFTRALHESDTFYAFEIWASEESVRAHAAGDSFQRFARRLRDLGAVADSIWRAGVLEPFKLTASKGSAA
jgi:quinol monooxygenase YgiN